MQDFIWWLAEDTQKHVILQLLPVTIAAMPTGLAQSFGITLSPNINVCAVKKWIRCDNP